MTDDTGDISVIVALSETMRGDGATRQSIPIRKLADEVKEFVGSLQQILDRATQSTAGIAILSEVEVSASIEVGGKLSLLGTGVESKGHAGLKFKFILPAGKV